jgi:hypothetical protein
VALERADQVSQVTRCLHSHGSKYMLAKRNAKGMLRLTCGNAEPP